MKYLLPGVMLAYVIITSSSLWGSHLFTVTQIVIFSILSGMLIQRDFVKDEREEEIEIEDHLIN